MNNPLNLEALSVELTRKWGEDAAQHALMRIVEKGWHLDPGENEVIRFARVTAKNYRITLRERYEARVVDEVPEIPILPSQLGRAEAREALSALLRENPTAVIRAVTGSHSETARVMGVRVGTVKSRLNRKGGGKQIRLGRGKPQ